MPINFVSFFVHFRHVSGNPLSSFSELFNVGIELLKHNDDIHRRLGNTSKGIANNASKLIQKYFRELRKLFLNQENIENFSQNKKIYLAEKNFLVLWGL